MNRIGNIPAIVDIKSRLSALQQQGLIKEWAAPYENLVTRLDAAIFFLAPASEQVLDEIWSTLGRVPGLKYQPNAQQGLSDLPWQVQFGASASTG